LWVSKCSSRRIRPDTFGHQVGKIKSLRPEPKRESGDTAAGKLEDKPGRHEGKSGVNKIRDNTERARGGDL